MARGGARGGEGGGWRGCLGEPRDDVRSPCCVIQIARLPHRDECGQYLQPPVKVGSVPHAQLEHLVRVAEDSEDKRQACQGAPPHRMLRCRGAAQAAPVRRARALVHFEEGEGA